MGFIILLLISTLSIAGSAAFFSIYGLARVFSGAFLPVVIMASSLESGKLVAASFLYRYWSTITRAMKAYLISAVVVLMLITSMGIFGYLSSAYQDNVLPFEQHNQQIELLESEKTELQQLKTERLTRQDEINKQIANLPNNFVNGRRRLIDANKAELTQITKDVAEYTKEIRDHTTEISKLKGQTVQETAHVGPIIFMARAVGLDVNETTKWLIMLIICVFDPLAVMLTIATNKTILDYKKKKEEATVLTTVTTKTNDLPISTPKIDDVKPTTLPTFGNIELSDPPSYSEDHQFIKSKDGMVWSRVAPHAAAPAVPTGEWGNSVVVAGGEWKPRILSPVHNVTDFVVPSPPQPAPIVEPVVQTPNHVRDAFDVFSKADLSPQEKRMKEELETLLKRHQEVLDANQTRSKS